MPMPTPQYTATTEAATARNNVPLESPAGVSVCEAGPSFDAHVTQPARQPLVLGEVLFFLQAEVNMFM